MHETELEEFGLVPPEEQKLKTMVISTEKLELEQFGLINDDRESIRRLGIFSDNEYKDNLSDIKTKHNSGFYTCA